MKINKLSRLLTTTTAAILVIISCSKSEKISPKPAPDPTPGTKVDITVTGDFNDLGTKAEVENVFRMTWSDVDTSNVRDTVYVYGVKNGESSISFLGKLAAFPVAGTGNRVADLTGTITEPEDGSKITLVYSPVLSSAPELLNDSISIDLKHQGGKPDSVIFVVYAAVDYKGQTSAAYRTAFNFATSILRVNVSDLTANTALTGVTLGDIETSCKLAVKGNDNPSVEGADIDTLIRTFTGCSANAKGNAAFYVAIPKITANEDRVLTVAQGENGVCEYPEFATGAAGCGQVKNAIARMEYGLCDLSLGGTANCYIVPGIGRYKFRATVKGNGNCADSIINPTSAVVLWESFGTDVWPNVGDLVKNVSLVDGYVNFTATDRKGNALIAVLNGQDTLWSWHIWLTDAPVPQIYANNAGIMMDRNLGATDTVKSSIRSHGLLYQWGRKDPYLSSDGYWIILSRLAFAAATGNWEDDVVSNANVGTIAYSIKHPMQFIRWAKNTNYDWLYTGESTIDTTRWTTSAKKKSVYDPCPAGWRVPDGGKRDMGGIWAKAFDCDTQWVLRSDWDSVYCGMNFGGTSHKLGTDVIWYPAVGYLNGGTGTKLASVYETGEYWSSTIDYTNPDAPCVYGFLFNGKDNFLGIGYVDPVESDHPGEGKSVRCAKE